MNFDKDTILNGLPATAIEEGMAALRAAGPHDSQGRLVLEPHEIEGAVKEVYATVFSAMMRDTMERLTMAGFVPPEMLKRLEEGE